MPFWPSLIISGLFSAFIALLLSYPFLKVKGIYFSILTLLTAETFRLVAYYWTSLTGGSLGLTGVPGPGTQNVPFAGQVDFDKTRELLLHRRRRRPDRSADPVLR